MILRNCRLISELSQVETTGLYNVEIENGKICSILSVGAGSNADEKQSKDSFDCAGKTLMPGLIDLHTHVSGLRGASAADLVTPMKVLVDTAELTGKYLDYGYTTIRDCGSFDRVANHVREMIERGIIEGPDVISCGLILTPTETERADSLIPMYAEGDSPDELRKHARRELAEHGDYIKIMASGSAFHPQGIPNQPIITVAELKAIVEVADMKSSYVAAHAHGDKAIRDCIENGVKTIEHATYITDETLDILEKTENCYLVPTLSAMHVSNPDGDEGSFWIKRLGQMLEACAGNIENAYKRGLKLGFGTDSTVGMDQYEQGLEFKYRKELCHMKDIDILLQVTKYNAEIGGLSDVGQVKAGYRANLILVDGNPDEDISAMYSKPMAVWKDGKKVK